jgi:hypothetical protein
MEFLKLTTKCYTQIAIPVLEMVPLLLLFTLFYSVGVYAEALFTGNSFELTATYLFNDFGTVRSTVMGTLIAANEIFNRDCRLLNYVQLFCREAGASLGQLEAKIDQKLQREN